MYKIFLIIQKAGSTGYALTSQVIEYNDRSDADKAFGILQDSRRHGSDITTLMRLY